MKAEDFFKIIDGIDDDLILDAKNPASEEPEKVVVVERRTPIWKIALSAACLISVLTAGVILATTLRGKLPVENISDPAVSVGDYSSDLISENISTNISAELPSRDFSATLWTQDEKQTALLEKNNDLKYAEVTIDDSFNISESSPLMLYVCADVNGETVTVSQTITVTTNEPQMYLINYLHPLDKGTRYSLNMIYNGGEEFISFKGHWEP